MSGVLGLESPVHEWGVGTALGVWSSLRYGESILQLCLADMNWRAGFRLLQSLIGAAALTLTPAPGAQLGASLLQQIPHRVKLALGPGSHVGLGDQRLGVTIIFNRTRDIKHFLVQLQVSDSVSAVVTNDSSLVLALTILHYLWLMKIR